MKGPVVLLTDFGLKDHYVGVMKGVILSRVPQALLVDLTHEVPPQDVKEGAYLLGVSYPYFPKGSVFLGVVDPGVGTLRRALVVEAGGRFFVGPDNGLFTWIFRDHPSAEIRALEERRFLLPKASATFHGRDLFAPVVAEILKGRPLSYFGPVVKDPVQLSFPEPEPFPGGLKVPVLRVDRFGNLILPIRDKDLGGGPFQIVVEGERLPFRKTYGEVPEGASLALIGSDGFLEIAVCQGSAAQRYGPEPEILILWS